MSVAWYPRSDWADEELWLPLLLDRHANIESIHTRRESSCFWVLVVITVEQATQRKGKRRHVPL
jgi:hypothetical protein